MTKEEAITALSDRNNLLWGMSKEEQKHYSEALDMAISALKGGWIPLTTRPMTDEEITEYRNCAECGEIFDCPLPDDGQEVLISVNGYTGVDTFVIDEGCYFEQADIFDVDAWQPLPKPYKESEEV